MFSIREFRSLMHEMAVHYGVSKVRVVERRRKGYITTKILGAPSLETCVSLMNRVCNLAGCFNEMKKVKPNSVTFSISH